MNIMLFSRICAKTGVGNHMRQLSYELLRQGHSVWIISGSNEQGIEEKEGLSFVELPFQTKNPLTIWKNLRAIHRIITENNIDIVHCHHRVAALYMKIERIFHKIPMVYTLHLAPVPNDLLHRKLTYVGDMGIAVSTEVAEFMKTGLKIADEKVTVVLNGVEVPETPDEYDKRLLKTKFSVPENKYVLLLNSRIDAVKNHMIMVEAINELPQEVKDKIIVLCTGKKEGDYYKAVVDKINEYGISEQFKFVGWINPYEISAIADFLFLPSLKEGFALSIIEAFFMKLPTARTATGGWKDSKTGCLQIFPDRTDEIKKIIIDLISGGGVVI